MPGSKAEKIEEELDRLNYFERQYSGFKGKNGEYVEIESDGLVYDDGSRIRSLDYNNWTEILEDVESSENNLSHSAKLLVEARSKRGMTFVHPGGSK